MGMGDFLGRIFYQAEVDTGGVDRGLSELEGKVETAVRRMAAEDAIIELKAEKEDFDKKIMQARGQVQRLERLRPTLTVDGDIKRWEAAYALVSRQVASLSKKRANIAVRLDEKNQFIADAKKVNNEVDKIENIFGSMARRISSARVNLGPFTLTARALVPVLTTLAPLLTDLVGGIVAVGSSLAAAAAGGLAVGAAGFTGLAAAASGVFFAIKPLITDFKTAATAASALKTAQLKYGKSSKEAQQAQQTLNQTLSGMPPQAEAAARAWSRLKASFAERTSGIQTDFFSLMADAMKTANQLMPAFARNATIAFHVATDGVQQWLNGLRSPEAQNILNNITQNFTKSLPALLHGLGQFAAALFRIDSAASDFLPGFTKGFDRVGTEFSDATSNASDLHRTMAGLVDQTHSWFALLGATGRLMTTVIAGGAKSGQTAVDDLTNSIDTWNTKLQSASGQRGMSDFFSQSVAGSEQFIGVLRRLLTFLFEVSRATQPLSTGILSIVTALADVSSALVQLRPARAILAGIGAAIATYFVASKVLAFVGVLKTIPAALRVIGAQATITEAQVNPFLGLISAAAGAVVALGIAQGDSVTPAEQMAASQQRATDAAHNATAAFRDESTALRTLRGDSLSLKQAHLDVAQAQMAVRQTTKEAQQAAQKYGKNSQQAKQADLARRQAVLSLKQAQQSEGDAERQQSKDLHTVWNAGNRVVTQYHKRITAIEAQRTQIRGEINDDKAYIQHFKDTAGMEDQVAQKEQDLRSKREDLHNVTKALNAVQKDESNTLAKNNQISDKAIHEVGGLHTKISSILGPIGSAISAFGHLSRGQGNTARAAHGLGDMIGQVTNKVLGSFGAKTLNFSLPAISQFVSNIFQRGGQVGEQKRAAGGFTVPGAGDGDKVHTQLPVGSFILNRKATRAYGFQKGGMANVALEPGERVFGPSAVNAIGPENLHAMNATVPRFAHGGTLPKPVELLWQVPGHYDHLHAGFSDTPTTIAAGKAMQGMGYSVGEGPGPFGPITPGVHVNGSLHYQNRAVDVNDDAAPFVHGGSEGSSLSYLYSLLAHGSLASGAGAVKQIPRIKIKGPNGPLKTALQSMSDKLRKAANAYIRKHAPKETGGVGTAVPVGGGVLSRGEMRKLLKAHGMPDVMGWVALAESGFNPHAVNPSSGAFGLWQDLPSTWAGLGVSGDQWDPNVQATGNAKLYNSQGLTPWDASSGGWGPHQGEPFATGGYVGEGHGNGYQSAHLPPKPKKNKRHDYSTNPGSWYDWFQRAISFYDDRGDRRNDLGKTGLARADWKTALTDIVSEEKQIKRIIGHDKDRMHDLEHKQHRLPKHLRKSEPPKHFHFRKKGKHEKQKDYHKAKHAAHKEYRQKVRAWHQAVHDYKKGLKDHERSIKQSLPDLYSQMRTDLPNQYNDIRDKIKGQATSAALEQTEFGTERYDTLLEFGGNFAARGFGVHAPPTRSGTGRAVPGMGGAGRATTPTAQRNAMSFGARATSGAAARAAASSGGGTTKVVNVTNHFLTQPSDPHTWSRNVQYELGVLG